jgi:GT2 family glycosyltransferase
MKISVVIPNWNGRKQLEENLPFVLKEKPDEVIVVDDASIDDSCEFITGNFPNVKLLKNEKNVNFAETVNRGVDNSSHELVCILNADVRPRPKFISNAIKYFKDDKLFGITLHESENGPAVSKFELGFVGFDRGKESNIPQRTFWISGGSSILRKDLWEKLGGFDSELFPFYWEDLDISYRASKRGYKLLWAPDCIVDHRHETFYKQKYSSSKLSFEKEVRQLVFIWKNITDNDLFLDHIKGLSKRILKSPGYSKVLIATILKLSDILPKRRLEKLYSLVSDKEVFTISSGKE